MKNIVTYSHEKQTKDLKNDHFSILTRNGSIEKLIRLALKIADRLYPFVYCLKSTVENKASPILV